MQTILVTGSSGLVGKAIQSLNKNYNFIYTNSTQCDLTDYNKTLEMFNRTKPDAVIHLAAYVGGLFKNMNEKVNMYEKNILINTNVIKAAYESGINNLVACLSTCIFPDGKSKLDETMLHDGPPHNSNEGYAYAKRMMEVHCRMYRETFGKRYFCVIPTNIYGPHDNFHLEDAHVIPALIHKCYLASKQDIPFEVKGSGKPLRQFIYSVDLAKIIFILLENNFNENIIIAPSQEYSIKYISETINGYFNNKIVFNNDYADGQYSKTADNLKLTTLINFRFTSLEEGIKETIQWFLSNYETLRK
jgi:GDP-L-fucose synthase